MILRHVNIEPTNNCQLNCDWCGDRKERPVGVMSIKDYLKIIGRIPASELRLFLSGEPLLHPFINLFAGIALSRGHHILIHSNGIELSKLISQRFIVDGFKYPNKMTLSFSFDKRTPEKMINKISEEITYLAKLNKEFGNSLNIIIQTIVPKGEELVFPSWVTQLDLGKWGVIHNARYPHNWDKVDSINGSEKQKWEVPCGFVQDSVAIYWNGDVPVCCTDLNGDRIIGNILEDSFEEIVRRIDKVAEQQKLGRATICKGCERYEEADNKPTR